jgi:hypothetical protein
MKPKNRWKGWLLVSCLATAGAISTTPVPSRACVFLKEFQKSSKAAAHVSVWERVVYSLIEANNQTTERRAPSSVTTTVRAA